MRNAEADSDAMILKRIEAVAGHNRHFSVVSCECERPVDAAKRRGAGTGETPPPRLSLGEELSELGHAGAVSGAAALALATVLALAAVVAGLAAALALAVVLALTGVL